MYKMRRGGGGGVGGFLEGDLMVFWVNGVGISRRQQCIKKGNMKKKLTDN